MNFDSFDAVERNRVARAVVEFGCSRNRVGCYGLGVFDGDTVFKIGGNTSVALLRICCTFPNCKPPISLPQFNGSDKVLSETTPRGASVIQLG